MLRRTAFFVACSSKSKSEPMPASSASPLRFEVTAFDAKTQRFDVRAGEDGGAPFAPKQWSRVKTIGSDVRTYEPVFENRFGSEWPKE
jgi:hypothetical protein